MLFLLIVTVFGLIPLKYFPKFRKQTEGMTTVDQLKAKNKKDVIALVKTVGDMLPAGQGCAFYSDYLGFSVNEGYCGIGGLVSALISSYELYEW